jgi:hypothetical protein
MSRRLSALLTVLALLPFAESAFAQIDTGVIVGRVTDDSGAVLPGVTVVATQEGTGVASTTVTNERGEFIFPGLRVGVYAVAAELQGFKRAMRRDIRVSVQTRAQVDLQLNVGALAEEVIVTARTELLQTQSADIGNVVDARQVRDLPLLGRRYSELAFLSPGVVAAPAGITSRGEDTFFNANGNYATWNNYTLDGADNNSFSTNLQERSPQVVQPPVDALSEFKVQTRTYSAEFGKAAGAVINASVKQGTNQFSGSLFGFFRDESLNANTWDNIPRQSSEGPVQPADRRRHTRRTHHQQQDVLLRRLPVVAHRARPVADGDGADGADAGRRSQRADGQHGRDQRVRAGRLRRCGQQDHQPVVLRSGRGQADRVVPDAERARHRILQQQLHLERHPEQRRGPVRHPHRSQPVRRQRSPVRALQLPEHRSGMSRRCSMIQWRPAILPATS